MFDTRKLQGENRKLKGSMKLELYKKYKLKDGRTGTAVDILGDGEACIFELDTERFEDRVITVLENEIDVALT